jgi:hypothetical protein
MTEASANSKRQLNQSEKVFYLIVLPIFTCHQFNLENAQKLRELGLILQTFYTSNFTIAAFLASMNFCNGSNRECFPYLENSL